jgi:hypothetical protein
LNEWTLPCSLDNLLGYIKITEGPEAASKVATKLQQEALTLTPQGKINIALAKDQLMKLKDIMRKYELYNFSLPLPGKYIAKVVQEPLELG